MRRDVGSAFDGEYFAALEAWTQDALPFVFTLASQAEDPDAPILGAPAPEPARRAPVAP
jgi:hypothetical protein